jgi:hypothetical protein
LGRVLGGVSTNLLFSAFESWMTTEHRKKGFPEEWMQRTYSEVSLGLSNYYGHQERPCNLHFHFDLA